MKPTRPMLDYSTSDDVKNRVESEVQHDHRAAEIYNRAAFGERRPIVGPISRLVVAILFVAMIVYALPRDWGRVVELTGMLAFAAWEVRRSGDGFVNPLRPPWRWW